MEPRTLLQARMKEWTDEWYREGFEEGNEKGIERGIEKGIETNRTIVRQQAALKFGSETAAELSPLLDRLSDPGRIAEVANAVIQCDTGEVLIARAREVVTGEHAAADR